MAFNPTTVCYCAMEQRTKDKKTVMCPYKIERHAPGDEDIVFRLVCCGVCHSDLHFVENDLGNSRYPLVPGHELAGIVTHVGNAVTKFAVGDKVAVGCFVDSCRECEYCKQGDEQYCVKGMTMTYGSDRDHGRAGPKELGWTQGGYSSQYTINEKYAISVPGDYPLTSAGPLCCSAITMWDPLCHWGCKEGGKKVGIVGIGGLGTFGIKLAKALGNEVFAFTTNPKKAEKIKEMGAEPILSTDADAMAKAAGSIDLILDTVSAKHDIKPLVNTLRSDGTLVMIGLVAEPLEIVTPPMLFGRKSVAGSLIAGIASTQECMNFCAEKKIYQETELVPVDKVNEVYEKLESVNDLPVRYVLDIEGTMPKADSF
eukprot:CAMPEP_0178401334 /NCGR_PEP_ID=MMETSP0689_2-20121128/16248_1 /TAXON_ID=160604 /ORGANISM="Amphidinium massartii, Strain CS-259" /LENGTH=369 /DNA_ID=CAMNT_0020022151 /DNA_START=75 /DNA_END=1184 /DNA_ORIENTATION=+